MVNSAMPSLTVVKLILILRSIINFLDRCASLTSNARVINAAIKVSAWVKPNNKVVLVTANATQDFSATPHNNSVNTKNKKQNFAMPITNVKIT